MRRWSILLVPAVARMLASPAFAQFGPGGGMRPGGQPQGNPAQAAPRKKKRARPRARPRSKAENPALQPLPAWPQQREKTLQFFELHGYIRFRAYLFHALNLGIWRGPMGPQSPFPIPYSEVGSTGQADRPRDEPGVRAAPRATSPTAAPTT